MREPWDLAQNYIQSLQQQAAQNRADKESRIQLAMQAQLQAQQAETAQNYRLEDLAEGDRYARVADTTAFNRQLQRDDVAYGRDDQRFAQNRRFQLADQQTELQSRLATTTHEQQLIAAREAAERGDTGRPRRFGSFDAMTIQAESGGNPNARNDLSSATGTHGFLEGTWKDVMTRHPELGLTLDGRTDPEQSARAHEAFKNDNMAELEAAGVEVTPMTLRAAHHFGARGAIHILSQPDDAMLSDVVHPQIIQANPHLEGKTVGQVKQLLAKQVGDTYQGTGRRYGAAQDEPTHSDRVLSSEVPSSAAGARNGGVAAVSPWMQSYLDQNGLEAVQRVTMTEQQYELLPDEWKDNMFIADIADTTMQGVRGGKSEYIQVQPRRTPPPQAAQQAAKPAAAGGNKLKLAVGEEIELPD